MLAHGLAADLEASGRGVVVNVTSIVGGRVHPFAGSAYATSKAALTALTREMASDFGRARARTSAVPTAPPDRRLPLERKLDRVGPNCGPTLGL